MLVNKFAHCLAKRYIGSSLFNITNHATIRLWEAYDVGRSVSPVCTFVPMTEPQKEDEDKVELTNIPSSDITVSWLESFWDKSLA